jgi:outer membrane protein assembly factor BamB
VAVEAVIELDRFPSLDQPWDAEPRRRGPPVRLVFTVLITAGLVLGGAGTPTSRPSTALVLRTGDTAGFRLTDTALYVTDRRGDSLTAYSLHGERRWTARVRLVRAESILQAGDTVLVAETVTESTTTVALDTRTGVARWRRAGQPFTANDAAGLGTVVVEEPAVEHGGLIEPPTTVTGVDLKTGRPRWAYLIGQGVQVRPALVVRVVAPQQLVVVGAVLYPQGEPARYVDFTTGRVVPAAHLPPSLANNFVVWLGDLMVSVVPLDPPGPGDSRVLGPFGERWIIQAYASADLRPLWRTSVTVGSFAFARCGGAVCVSTAGRLMALDSASGVLRWQGLWTYAVGGPGRVFAVDGRTDSEMPRVGVVDAQTGETLLDLGRWLPVSYADGVLVPLLRPLNRSGLDWEAVVLDTDRLAVRRLGAFHGSADQCQANGAQLVCPTGDGQLMIWQYAA